MNSTVCPTSDLESGLPSAGFLMLGVPAVLGAFGFGGLPWGGLLTAALVAVSLSREAGHAAVSLGLGVSLLWMLLALNLDNRQLFFPCTLYQSAFVILGRRRRILAYSAGVTLVAAFALIRIQQGVTAPILLLELVVASVVLTLLVVGTRRYRMTTARKTGLAAWASVLAFGGLAL